MVDELEKQVQAISVKLKERDEAKLKEAEKEWRESMRRDTAGHVLGVFQLQQAQIASLQAQLDASNPLAPIVRVLDANVKMTDAIVSKLAEIDQRLAAVEKGLVIK